MENVAAVVAVVCIVLSVVFIAAAGAAIAYDDGPEHVREQRVQRLFLGAIALALVSVAIAQFYK